MALTEDPHQSADGAPGISAATRACTAFAQRFGRPPVLAAAAPGRVNLIGEHTDYNEGAVLPIAIDRHTVVTAAPAPPGAPSTMVALDLDESARARLWAPADPLPAAAWAAYVCAVARQMAPDVDRRPELDLLITSDVPIGAGLSSSAALGVATATLLARAAGLDLDPREKARRCRRAEHEATGVRCGIMDMYASACAEAGHALLIDCRTESARAIPLPPPDEITVLVVDTGVGRRLAAGGYEDRRAACARVAARLEVPALRDAGAGDVEHADLDHADRRRARHVVREHARTLLAARLLEAGDASGLGRLLWESHASLRDDYEVSCPELDTVVEAARGLRGPAGPVLGARMTGAGFGGCAIVLARTDGLAATVSAVERAFTLAHGRRPTAFPVRAAGGAAAVDPDRLRS